jgi:hypothetical protein
MRGFGIYVFTYGSLAQELASDNFVNRFSFIICLLLMHQTPDQCVKYSKALDALKPELTFPRAIHRCQTYPAASS